MPPPRSRDQLLELSDLIRRRPPPSPSPPLSPRPPPHRGLPGEVSSEQRTGGGSLLVAGFENPVLLSTLPLLILSTNSSYLLMVVMTELMTRGDT